MTEKTTEQVVVSETNNGQQTAKQSRRKSAARKPATTKKKAAKKEDAVEPAIEAKDAEAPAKKQPQRRGRKPKQTTVEAANTIIENNDAPVQASQLPTPDTQEPEAKQDAVAEVQNPVSEEPKIENVKAEEEGRAEEAKEEVKPEVEVKEDVEVKAEVTTNTQHPTPNTQTTQKPKPIPAFNPVRIDTIVDMVNAPKGQLLLNDQQIQQLSPEEALKRFRWIEGTLAWVLNYDVVISDTNIWLELLIGHTSSHSDPKVNARLMFERQLEFISKLVRFRGGRFMMMSETYEEIDRFATQQAPTNYKDADFSDEALCRNVSARLAKRLILSQLRENRLKIEGICAESHHAAFADPAIIRKTVELFSTGKRVLLLTNDASVAIRSMGMCDDLQRINAIDDETWERVYSPLRPMVITMEDLKVLDLYTRQYHFLQMAAGKQWMEDVPQRMEKRNVQPLALWLDGFRPGDKQSEMHKQQKQNQPKQEQQKKQKQQNQAKQEQQKAQELAEQPKQQKQQQARLPQPKNEPKQPQAEPKPEAASELVIVTDIPDAEVLLETPANAEIQEPTEVAEQPTQQQRRRPQRRRPQRKRPQQAQQES
jgi:hypothetical protein